MGMVTLYDGRQVDSASAEWMAQCEVAYILAKSIHERAKLYELIGQRRGPEALEALKKRCFDLEPYFVLGLPNKAQRQDYLAKVEHRFGPNASNALKAKLLALHAERQAVAVKTAASA